jgi:feruloyl-CoA synthase
MAAETGVRSPQFPGPLFAPPRITAEPAAGVGDPDGTLVLRSDEPLGDYPVSVVHSLRDWAGRDPGHPLVAERSADGGWRVVSYGEAVAAADAIGQGLLDRGLGAGRPLLILSGNGVNHLLMTLGALTAGVPVAPVSVAYSVQSKDHARIRAIAGLITPGAVYADDAVAFGAALDTVLDTVLDPVHAAAGGAAGGTVTAIAAAGGRPGVTSLPELLATAPGDAVHAAFEALTPDAVAKVLFTSGSTGSPKGVLNTHRMMSANQRMIGQAWPFLRRERPVIVDWLPWSHTFGGNHNVNMMIVNGGTLYVDAGRPAPGLFGQTVANLTDVPPTIYFNVPAGYAQLVPALEADGEFAARFFSRLRLLFNAAAALPAALRERLETLAARHAPGRDIPVTGSWGATETAPAVTSANFPFTDAGCIGAPLPGARVKLVPVEDAYEIRVKGPNVTPGYYARPDLTAEAFDAGGFYRTGDTVAFAAPGDLSAGLLFRGRIAEDFKLDTGTFVRVGAVRPALLSSVSVLSDAVLAGENRAYVSALAWLNAAETRKLLGRDPDPPAAGDAELITDPDLLRHLAAALAAHNQAHGSAARVERLLLLARPASLDAGEITDKGYVNQRKVLAERAPLVTLLYTDPTPPAVATPRPG